MSLPARIKWSTVLATFLLLALAGLRPGVGSAHGPGAPGRAGVAATAEPTMTVSAGYDTYFRPGAWLPVRVRISNPGATFSGQLRIDDSAQQGGTAASPVTHTAYRRDIVMPQGSTKDFTLFLPGADVSQGVSVSLVAPGVPGLTGQATISTPNLGTLLVGVLSRSSAALTQLKAMSQRTSAVLQVVPLNNRTLDAQPLALASLDVLVISDFTTADLTTDQSAAIEDWVRAGGTLIEIGGPTAQTTVAGLPPSLRLMQPGQPLTVSSLPGLSGLGGRAEPLPAGETIIGGGSLLAGTVLLDQRAVRIADGGPTSGAPLVVQRTLGRGSVVYCAADPTLLPLATWNALPKLWNLLVAPARAGAATTTTVLAGTQPNPNQSGGDLGGEIDNVSPPSITLFVVLLGIYVLVLIPLNFILLQRLRRRDWSWITLPVLATVLVAATFGTTYVSRGRSVRLSVVSAVFLTSGSERVATQSYVGLFAPLAGDYTVTADDLSQLSAPLFTPFQGGQGGQGGPSGPIGLELKQDTASARMPSMNVWSSRNVAFAGLTSYRGGLDGVLHPDGNGHLMGRLTNRGAVTLHSVVLAPFGGSFTLLGDLAPGQSVQVNVVTGSGAGQSPQSISDFYGNSSMVLPAEMPAHATPRAVAQTLVDTAAGQAGPASTRRPPGAADRLSGYDATESRPAGTARLLADTGAIPTNPDESVSERFQHVLQQVFPGVSPNTLDSVVALAWVTQPVTGLTVNGDRPGRQDTDLLVQSIPMALQPGGFTLNGGSLPAQLAGSDADLQQYNGFSGGGVTISNNSSATFVAQLPAPLRGSLSVSRLNLAVSVGGAGGVVTPQTVALYNWKTGDWDTVDASNGVVTVSKAARYVSAVGLVRVRIAAGDNSISLSDLLSGVTIGVEGTVR